MKININLLWLLGVFYTLTSCSNKEIIHPDFDYQTVYFGSQYPIRTVELGEDPNVDNSLDNEHKVSIKASLGGTRNNQNHVEIEIAVDESLINNLYFPVESGAAKVLPMPAAYYTLASNKITIAPGNMLGGVEVQLTDAFFADPLAIQNTYAIPLVMKTVSGADSILSGKSTVDNPNRHIDADWEIKPLDYVIYAIKYVNQWHGNYLRRGKDVITYQGETNATDLVRHATFVEQDEVNKLSTRSLDALNFPVTFKDKNGTNVTCTLVLTFAENGTCTISSGTAGVTVSGTGAFVKRGEKKSWGNEDRDALYLDYNVSMTQLTASTKDTLVMRDRAVSPEYFTPELK